MTLPGFPKVHSYLGIHPNVRSRSKGISQRQSCLGRNAQLSRNKIVYPGRRPAKMARQSELCDFTRLEKHFFEYFTRRCRTSVCRNSHISSISMIVGDFDVCGSFVRPPEYNAPLSIDSYAVFSLHVSLESFQSVASGRFQV